MTETAHNQALVPPDTQPAPSYSFADVQKMAVAIAKSGLFGVNTPEQALALMLLAQAEGLHPVTAARDYHIIDGRPALKADAMLARFIRAGGKVRWHRLSDEAAVATFSHPDGGSVQIDWTIVRARRAGLGGKPMWAKYPRQMLRSRVISEGIRTVYPAVATGVYTPEEVSDFDEQGPAGIGMSHLQEKWHDPNGETLPDDEIKERRRMVVEASLSAGLTPDQVRDCLGRLGWPLHVKDLTEEQMAELVNTRLAEYAETVAKE